MGNHAAIGKVLHVAEDLNRRGLRAEWYGRAQGVPATYFRATITKSYNVAWIASRLGKMSPLLIAHQLMMKTLVQYLTQTAGLPYAGMAPTSLTGGQLIARWNEIVDSSFHVPPFTPVQYFTAIAGQYTQQQVDQVVRGAALRPWDGPVTNMSTVAGHQTIITGKAHSVNRMTYRELWSNPSGFQAPRYIPARVLGRPMPAPGNSGLRPPGQNAPISRTPGRGASSRPAGKRGGKDSGHRFKKPPRKTKQHKANIRNRALFSALLRAMERVTEYWDYEAAIYEALPYWRKVQIYEQLGRQPNRFEKTMFILRYGTEIDPLLAVANIIDANLEDHFYAAMGKLARQHYRGTNQLTGADRAMRWSQRAQSWFGEENPDIGVGGAYDALRGAAGEAFNRAAGFSEENDINNWQWRYRQARSDWNYAWQD